MSNAPEHGYWRSLAELRKDRDYTEQSANEFSAHAAGSPADDVRDLDGMSRRRFLALAGASTALAATACDRLDNRGDIVPYVRQPVGTATGEPRLYASTLLSYPGAPPVLVQTREGRPIKVEGNPDHPASAGALGAFGQSATLLLYDPDRLREPAHETQPATWDVAITEIRSALADARSRGAAALLITPSIASPTTRKLIRDFQQQYPNTRHVAIETFHAGNAVEGREIALRNRATPTIAWNRANAVLSVECDILGVDGAVTDQSEFARRRDPDSPNGMLRLWMTEGPLSLTGSNADHRLRIRPSDQGTFLLGLLHEIVIERQIGPLAGRSDLADAIGPNSLNHVVAELGLEADTVRALVNDLVENRGHCAVIGGPRLSVDAHVIVAALNASLGAEGTVLTGESQQPTVSTHDEIASAVDDMSAGRVGVVINLGTNPVYSLPRDLAFADALARVPTVVSASLLSNETTTVSHWTLPLAHDLESWGDTDRHTQTLTLQQPTILPLHAARQAEDILIALMAESNEDNATSYHDYLKSRWRDEVYPALRVAAPFEQFWHSALHDGFVVTRDRVNGAIRLNPTAVIDSVQSLSAQSRSGVDVVLLPSYTVYDGRFANSGWLQENPQPITSQVWGNGAVIAPAFAERNKIEDGDAVTVSIDGREVTLPAIIQPGYADNTVSIELGYGRTASGNVETGIGVDAAPLMVSRGGISSWIYTGADVKPSRARVPRVVRTQEHHNMHGRPILNEGTLSDYREKPDFVKKLLHEFHEVPEQGDWQERWYNKGSQWGMAIDLNLCTGCGGCTVACYAENNIPVVGPEQVAKGREMAWIRIDTYYRDDAENPMVAHQPMLCQHCENAPCEVVCPVAATTHSPDGLNEMIYNRCVGTRYCANNCPFKVRRFNFYNWHEDLISPQELVFNPEVTVRSRGVMEKCTFCVQRIRIAQQDAKEQGRQLDDGELQTACQQACPSDAIVFGDLNNPESNVSKLSKNPRGYAVLGTLNTRPRITYLAKIRNPHPDLGA